MQFEETEISVKRQKGVEIKIKFENDRGLKSTKKGISFKKKNSIIQNS